MFKAIKVRLYPNKAQKELLQKNCGCARFVFNHFLAKRIEIYAKTKGILSTSDCSSELTSMKSSEEFEWLKEVDSTSLQQSIINLDQAYKNFFRRTKQGVTPGFPKFKSKGVRDSFRCVMSLQIEENYLKIGKHGWIKFRGNEDILNTVDKIKSITVSFDAGHWYASCLIEADAPKYVRPRYEACGIDLGVVKPLTVVYENTSGIVETKTLGTKFSKDLVIIEERRKRYQKILARKQKGSANRNKAKLKVQRAYQRERNFRKNWIEQTSFQLASRFELVVFEDLRIQNMTKKGESHKTKLNQSMRRLGLSTLVTRTQQKVEDRKGNVVFVNPSYTSQTCNVCGCVSKLNRKSQAIFKCIHCGHTDNADRNAGLNILDLGLAA